MTSTLWCFGKRCDLSVYFSTAAVGGKLFHFQRNKRKIFLKTTTGRHSTFFLFSSLILLFFLWPHVAWLWAGSLLWDNWEVGVLLLCSHIRASSSAIMGLSPGLISSIMAHLWASAPLFNTSLWRSAVEKWPDTNLPRPPKLITRAFTCTVIPRNSPGNLH